MARSYVLRLNNENIVSTRYIVGYEEMLGGLAGGVTLQPGETTSGTLVYEVPTGVSPQTVVYQPGDLHGGERTFDGSVR